MDRIVSTVYYEGSVFIFTERGKVYRMVKDHTGQIHFSICTELRLEP